MIANDLSALSVSTLKLLNSILDTTSKTFYLIAKLIEKSQIDFTNLYSYLYERPIQEIKFHGYLWQKYLLPQRPCCSERDEIEKIGEEG